MSLNYLSKIYCPMICKYCLQNLINIKSSDISSLIWVYLLVCINFLLAFFAGLGVGLWQSTLIRSWRARQYLPWSWTSLIHIWTSSMCTLLSQATYSCPSWTSRWEIVEWGDFFLKTLHGRYVTHLGFMLLTAGFAVWCAADCATETSWYFMFGL